MFVLPSRVCFLKNKLLFCYDSSSSARKSVRRSTLKCETERAIVLQMDEKGERIIEMLEEASWKSCHDTAEKLAVIETAVIKRSKPLCRGAS